MGLHIPFILHMQTGLCQLKSGLKLEKKLTYKWQFIGKNTY